jgi:L-alanine-DL-glutamate epimerase-like enolase superfamily enzyme
MECVRFLADRPLDHVRFRLDANKAYTIEEAQVVYAGILSSGFNAHVDYVEQPLPVQEWSGHQLLVREFPDVPTMLDESIITKEDLARAVSMKIPFVKFKLFKQGGIRELVELSEAAWNAGIKVVLGNGVATEISNDVENAVYAGHGRYFGASEANGFQKVRGSSL